MEEKIFLKKILLFWCLIMVHSLILTSNFQEHAKDFFDDNATCDSLIQVATEVRDCIEIAHTSEYKKFLHFYFPAFEHVLRKRTKPQFVANKENKLRNSVVEILHRLPQNQTLKEHVERLLLLCTDVLKNDNELNALVALRVIFDVHKNFRPQLEDKLKAFFEYVVEKYRKFPDTVRYVFSGVAAPVPAAPTATPAAPVAAAAAAAQATGAAAAKDAGAKEKAAGKDEKEADPKVAEGAAAAAEGGKDKPAGSKEAGESKGGDAKPEPAREEEKKAAGGKEKQGEKDEMRYCLRPRMRGGEMLLGGLRRGAAGGAGPVAERGGARGLPVHRHRRALWRGVGSPAALAPLVVLRRGRARAAAVSAPAPGRSAGGAARRGAPRTACSPGLGALEAEAEEHEGLERALRAPPSVPAAGLVLLLLRRGWVQMTMTTTLATTTKRETTLERRRRFI